MPGNRTGTHAHAQLLSTLLERGLLIQTGVAGVYGRGPELERLRILVGERITEEAADEAVEQMRFPPVLPRTNLERVGYMQAFPHLAGSIFALDSEREHNGVGDGYHARDCDWATHQRMSELVLTPAACYPVYPAIAARGPLPPGGVTVDVGSACVFRNEPSEDPTRLQIFHQREIVRIGEPEIVRAWRDSWRDRALVLLARLGLAVEWDVASDPFFGRSGRMLASSQREQQLKFEILVPIVGDEPTAIASFNYHQEHFATAWGLRMSMGADAHTACFGFGLERIALALLHTHGFDVEDWPAQARNALRI